MITPTRRAIGLAARWFIAIAYGFVGFVVGNLAALPAAALVQLAIGQPFPMTWYNYVAGVTCLLGAALGFLHGYWRQKPSPSSDAMGSARWATGREVAHLAAAPGLLVGREPTRRGRLLRYDGPAHLLTIAPTRAGKGVGTIIPNLLTADRSVLAIDPKGENAAVTGRARARFGPVYVLDPFAITGLPGASYNPLDHIDPLAPDAAEDAALLADALVSDPPHQVTEAHWNEEAKALLTGLILFVAIEETAERRSLAMFRRGILALTHFWWNRSAA